jgi:putative PIN family toxin of toxin-antitoxin system
VRVVLDTNVLLSGVLTRGLCEALLDALFDSPEHRVFLSMHILEEFARGYRDKFGMTAAETEEALSFLRRECELVEPVTVPPGTCRDDSDLPVLGTLAASQVDFLVTGDADLLVLAEYEGRPILSPRQCYERLK